MKFTQPLFILLLTCIFLPAIVPAQSEAEKNAQKLVVSIQAGDQDAATFYNTACFFALAGKSNEAFTYLEGAIQRGYTNIDHIKTDSDLNSLHTDARWQNILDKAAAKQTEQQKAVWNQKDFWDSPSFNIPYKENLSEDEKIAGLSKFWSEVKYNFVNFDLIPGLNWDATYMEFLPKIKQTKSTLEYYRLLQEMCARLKDGHTNVRFPKELSAAIFSRPLIRTRLVEDKVLIIRVFDESLRQKGIEVGEEIVEIDGLPVREYAAKFVAPFQSASTQQDLDARTYEYSLLNGAAGSDVKLTLRNADGRTFQSILPRPDPDEVKKLNLPQTPPFELKMLPGNIAYVTLNTFNITKTADDFAAAFDEIAKSNALILDVRNNGGGNSTVGYSILSYLTDKFFKGSKWYTRDYRPVFRPQGRAQENYGKDAGEIAPDGKKVYTKPVIVLISPRTYSAAEDFTVAYVNMKRGRLIGEATGGSTGQPMFFSLPGGGSAQVCTKRDKFPDGTDFIGKGIQPDKVVRPTIADVRAGRDTTLEAALNELK